jgi:hypothetical protein
VTAKKPALPWLPPQTKSTWVCAKGHINLKTVIACCICRR